MKHSGLRATVADRLKRPVRDMLVKPDKPKPTGFIAYVDQVGPNFIRGWAADLDRPGKSLRLRVYLDDALVAEGDASTERDDLKAAGYGEGRHAYHLPIPTKALFCAEHLTLACVDAGRETTILRVPLRETAMRGTPVLHLDASDLIEFLTSYREISGIQRVQAGYLLGLGDAKIGEATCRICTRVRFHNWYYEIPQASFAGLLRAAGDPQAVPKDAWADHVQRFKESLTRRAEIQPGDAVFTLGAPWCLDHHNELIRGVKLHYGARYYQIFYDLIPISAPEFVPAPLIPPFARAMAAMSVYADHIFSISEHAKTDLGAALRGLGYPEPPNSVVPMGGSITDAETPEARQERPPPRLGLEGPFVLCVGTLEPRKNHILLFQVWRRLVAKYGAANVPKLVLVGRVGWYMEDFMRMLKVTSYAEGTIVHLTGITNAELDGLYDGCLFTAFPSFTEGWGLPITESLAHGKVCVCSNVTSMPEAGGDHALYIDPFDTSAAFDLCDRLIHDGTTLREKEAQLRATFTSPTWHEAAQGVRRQLAELTEPPRGTARKPIVLRHPYRFYNIDGAAPNATALQVFNAYLDQENALDLLAGWTWFDLDVNCTWACGLTAELSLVPPADPPDELVAYVEVVGFPVYVGARCEVSVDGRAAGSFTLAAETRRLAIGMPCGARDNPITLTFRIPDYRSPSGADLRMIGLGLRAVTIFDKADLEGRIGVLEAAASMRLA